MQETVAKGGNLCGTTERRCQWDRRREAPVEICLDGPCKDDHDRVTAEFQSRFGRGKNRVWLRLLGPNWQDPIRGPVKEWLSQERGRRLERGVPHIVLGEDRQLEKGFSRRGEIPAELTRAEQGLECGASLKRIIDNRWIGKRQNREFGRGRIYDNITIWSYHVQKECQEVSLLLALLSFCFQFIFPAFSTLCSPNSQGSEWLPFFYLKKAPRSAAQ